MKKNYMYCLEHGGAFMQGTKDSRIMKQDHAYLIYFVRRCVDERRNKKLLDPTCDSNLGVCETVDPPCADPQDIDEWIEEK